VRDVRKQYKRTHHIWEAYKTGLPIYGTIASHYNDPGIQVMFNKMIAGILPYMPKKLVWVFSKEYIAGETIEEAILAAKALNDEGVMTTIDVLGEFIENLDEAEANKNEYMGVIEAAEAAKINGNYSLKPVIRGYWDEGNGSAEGYAISTGYQVNVHAINNADTLGGTIANATTGYYFIGGLPQGNYSFSYESSNGKDTAVSAIQVIQNQTTVIDTVDLN